MNREKIDIPITILFCLFVYPVSFRFSVLISYMYIYGIPMLYLFLHRRYIKGISRRQRAIIFMSALLILFSFMYPIVHKTYDYSYVNSALFIFRKLTVYVFLACVIVKRYKARASVGHFMYYYAITHAVYVIGTILMVFVPGLKQFWFQIFAGQSELERLQESYGYTFRIGWQGFSGYRLTLHCSFCCIFLLYLYFVGGKTVRINFKQFFITYMLCLLGNMFYGRSGLMVSIVVSAVGVVIWNRQHLNRIVLFAVGIGLAISVVYAMRNIPVFSDWYGWMASPIINFFKYGSFNSFSVDSLNEMIFMPEWKTILFGDGYFTYDGHYYMRTDSGIMRNILFWGIAGMILSYGMTVYTIMDLKKKNKLLCLLMLFTFVVFEYKGDVYYEFTALLLSASFVESIRNRKYAALMPFLDKGYVWGIV